MRTFDLLVEQVAELLERAGDTAAAWQGNVVQRWIEPIWRLLAAVAHNREATCCILAAHIEILSKKVAALAKNAKHDASKAQKEWRAKREPYAGLRNEMQSVRFLVYMAQLRDILSYLKPLSLEGQEALGCAARIRFSMANVTTDIEALQNKNGPYLQTFLACAIVNSEAKTVHLSGELLNRDKAAEAWTAAKQLKKALLREIKQKFQNPTFQTMAVADCRYWTSAMVTENEKKLLIAVENLWGQSGP